MEKHRERGFLMRFFVDENEKEKIQKKASHNKSLSAYLRKMAMDGKVIVPKPSIDREALMEMTRIGNNINQIAHKINQAEANIFNKSTKAELLSAVEGLKAILEEKINVLDDHIYN
jgi:hypothetical protein